jgi:putative hemolysin
MTDLFLFYDLYSTNLRKSNLEKIRAALLEEHAVIFFPAGSVAKLTAGGVREGTWRQGPALFARKYGVPVLPIYVNAGNSLTYYLVTLINPGLSTLLLSNEMFKKRSQEITLKIGEPISKEVFESRDRDVAAQTEFLKEHVLRMGKSIRPLPKI